MEWVPESPDELLEVVEGQTGGKEGRGATLVAALRVATAGQDDFTALAAAVLTEIHDDRHYRAANHATFAAFVRAELPFGLRTAQEMVRVSRRLQALGVPHRRLRDLGWSKLALVVGGLTPENLEPTLAEVATLSFAALKARYARSPTRLGRTETPALVVTPVVADALARAAAESGGDASRVQQHLEWVCRRFLATRETASPTEVNDRQQIVTPPHFRIASGD